jgi:hypothetical protein
MRDDEVWLQIDRPVQGSDGVLEPGLFLQYGCLQVARTCIELIGCNRSLDPFEGLIVLALIR